MIMTDETTLTGDESAVEIFNPRNDDIESIANRLHPEPAETNEEIKSEEISQASEEPSAETSESDEQQADEQTEDEELLTLKVDGAEVKRSKKDVLEAGIKALQKESAADKRLREATELLNQVKQQQQNLRPSSDAAPVNNQLSIDAEIIRKIQYGDIEEAQSALESLLGRNKLDASAIEQLVDQQVSARLTVSQIQQRFNSEFSDIVSDPYLAKLAAEKADEKLRAGEPNSWETYKAAAEEIKEWKNKFTPKSNVESFADKKERKRSMTVINEASTKKVTPEDEENESITDVLNSMRRARKQTV